MKTLFLTPGCYDKGGISRYSRFQIAALTSLFGPPGVRTLSLLGPTRDSFEDEIAVRWTANGANSRAKMAFAARASLEVLRWRPDVLHVAHINLSGLAFALSRLCGAHVVLNTYGVEVWSDKRFDADFGLRHADTVMADCHATADYMEGEGIRPRGTTQVIWDCVDLIRYSPRPPNPNVLQKYGITDSAPSFNILTLGRLSKDAAYKGYTRLLEVFGRLAPTLPTLRLVFGGDGDLRPELEREASARGLRERVVFTGSIHEQDLPEVYRSAQVFSLVTERGPGRGEGIPLTPLEAMACGAPILVGNQDGSREAVDDSVNGFVLDPFDLDRHTSLIASLATNDELRRSLSAGAVRLARDRFSYEAFREKHRVLYARIVSRARTRSVVSDPSS
jgi:phosphatidylinositol alpha-1,6-mannosyltransferase